MSNFCILRIKKLHTDANVISSVSHSLRTRETENANAEEIKNNFYYPRDKSENITLEIDRIKIQNRAMSMYRKKLPEKIRKNGVRAVELMMTVSPEVMQKKDFNITKYLNACNNWARDKFGKDNVFFVAHHHDETTPHVSILFLPKDENGKLNARKLFGTRQLMHELQDDFYNCVGKEFGLDRGIKGSPLKHQEIKKWYANQKRARKEIENVIKNLTFPKKKIGQDQEEYDKEIQNNIIKELEPMFKKVADYDLLQSRFKALQEHFNDKEKALDVIIQNEVIKKLNELNPNLNQFKNDYEKLKNENKELSEKLDKWERATPTTLERTANIYRQYNVNNSYEMKAKQQQQKTQKPRYTGFSMSD